MRCFVAVDIPEEVKERISELQKEFSSFDVKIIEPKNLHFTLKFLGEIDETTINQVKEKLSIILKNQPRFSVLLSGVGTFPSITYIRIIWISTKSQDFINLHKLVSDGLKVIGKDDKEAVPHLTIARVRSPRDTEVIAKIIKRYEDEGFSSFTVDKVKLKKSTLTQRGPIYEDLGVFELGK